MRTLLYARVSHDRTGEQRSVEEQLDDLHKWVDGRGWHVVQEIIDNDVSASRHGKKKRPGWDQVMSMLRNGGVDALAVWEDSRTTRQLGEWTELRDLMRDRGIVLLAQDQVTDFSDAGQALSGGIKAVVSEHEATQAQQRIKRAMRANAAKGRPHGRRLFGYQRVYDPATGVLVGQEPHPDEAPVVQQMFADYLAGTGMRTVARRANEAGITTGTGSHWRDGQVRRLLTNPAYVARRVHDGVVVGSADWPALVDDDVFDRVQARLADQRGSRTRQVATARLLTGVGRCGKCGGKVVAIHDRGVRKVYTCRDKFEVSRDLLKLDAYVSTVIVERLSRPDVAEALSGSGVSPELDPAQQRVRELRGQLDDAVAEFTAGRLTAATLAKVEQGLLPQIEQAERDARKVYVGIDLDVPDDVQTWWDELTPELRREVVGTMLASVTILPTKRGTRTFDPDAVVIEWRG